MKKNYIILAITLSVIFFALGFISQKVMQANAKTDKGTPIDVSILNRLETQRPQITPHSYDSPATINMIKPFMEPLSRYSNRPCQQYTEGTYRQLVYVVSDDKKQAIVGHSCGSMGYDLSIVVQTPDKVWHKIGAKGFPLDIDDKSAEFSQEKAMASCTTAKKYNLDKKISPVCYNADGTYLVR